MFYETIYYSVIGFLVLFTILNMTFFNKTMIFVEIRTKHGDGFFFYFDDGKQAELSKYLCGIDKVWKGEGSGYIQLAEHYFDMANIGVYQIRRRRVSSFRRFLYNNRIC